MNKRVNNKKVKKKDRVKKNTTTTTVDRSITTPDNTLWNNPMTRAAISALSPEQLEKYQKIGEQLYGNVDFEHEEILNNMPQPMAEALAYIVEGLKSGLHPSQTNKKERSLLEECYGESWYEKFNYVKEDLLDIVTLEK
jgi:hypothetical protein